MRELLFERSPLSAHAFLRTVLNTLDAHNIALIVEPTLQVNACAGYFDDDPLTFAIAVGKPFEEWFLVLLHEFCHGQQYLEDATAFARSAADIKRLFDWMAHVIDLDPATVQHCAQVALALEYDCERRALSQLESLSLTHLVDAKAYAQKANAYFNFYHYVAKHRTWYVGGREPYSLPQVWSTFPTTLVMDSTMTPEREALFALCVEPAPSVVALA